MRLLSRPARGAWVEIKMQRKYHLTIMSRPARGAWVEIVSIHTEEQKMSVAPRKGRVG